MSRRLDHVGIVVKDINEASSLYGKMLGLTPWVRGVVEDSENGVRLLSLITGDTFIELIQPISSENRFAQFLKERGEGLFHLCFFVEDYDAEVRALKEKGFPVEEEEAKSFPNTCLGWLGCRPSQLEEFGSNWLIWQPFPSIYFITSSE